MFMVDESTTPDAQAFVNRLFWQVQRLGCMPTVQEKGSSKSMTSESVSPKRWQERYGKKNWNKYHEGYWKSQNSPEEGISETTIVFTRLKSINTFANQQCSITQYPPALRQRKTFLQRRKTRLSGYAKTLPDQMYRIPAQDVKNIPTPTGMVQLIDDWILYLWSNWLCTPKRLVYEPGGSSTPTFRQLANNLIQQRHSPTMELDVDILWPVVLPIHQSNIVE